MNFVESEVKKLLESDISAYRIAKDTGIPESTVKKLRNQNQKIENTKYEFIGKLYDYAMVNQDAIRDGELNDIKLPKAVTQFINDIEKQVKTINHVGAIRNVYVYDKYHMNENRDSENVNTFVEINETIGLPFRWDASDATPYQIHIKKEIRSKTNINSIRGLTIIFDKNKLIRDLKIQIQNGYKVKIKGESDKKSLVWSKAKNKGIYVSDIMNVQEQYHYETAYFDIQFNNQINTGSFPIQLIENDKNRQLIGGTMSNAPSKATFLVGESKNEEPVMFDLEKEAHILIDGDTHSDMSASLNFLITSLLWHSDERYLQTAFIDIKGHLLKRYQDIPFNITPLIDDIDDAKRFMDDLCDTLDSRGKILKANKCKDINEFNNKITYNMAVHRADSPLNAKDTMKRTVLFIEGGEYLIENKQIARDLQKLIQLGRPVGIHVILIKDNVNVGKKIYAPYVSTIRNRIFYSTYNESQNDYDDAYRINQGQALVSNDKKYDEELVQTPYISDKEMEPILNYMKQNFMTKGDD